MAALLVTVMVCAAELVPSVVVAKVRDEAESVGVVGVRPVPVREAIRVAGAAPVVLIMTVPARAPAAVGAKETATAQVLFAAILAPQVLVWLKSPVITTDATESATAALLVTVTVCGVEVAVRVVVPKVSAEGEMVGRGLVPVPVRVAVRMAAALPVVVTVRVPVWVPAVVGVKVMETTQVLFAAMLVPQVLVWPKSPVLTTDPMDMATGALLVTVTVWPAEVVLRVVAGKVSAEVERVGRAGACPVPVREAVSVAGALPVVMTVRVPVRVPESVGVKTMATVQELFAAMLVPQVLVWL